jgi:hypothetical protein
MRASARGGSAALGWSRVDTDRNGAVALIDRRARFTGSVSMFGQIASASSSNAAATCSRLWRASTRWSFTQGCHESTYEIARLGPPERRSTSALVSSRDSDHVCITRCCNPAPSRNCELESRVEASVQPDGEHLADSGD